MKTGNRGVIYARQSKDRNGDEIAVDRQVKSCRHMARAREVTLIRPPLIDNNVSAFTGAERPFYDEMMRLIRGGKIDVVLVWDMDRICRRIADLVDITRACRDHDVKIVSVHGDFDLSSPIGKMFATILIAVAEYEAEHKGERQAAANEQQARAGKRRMCTPMPFGWQADRVTREPAEADAIEWAADELLRKGNVSSVAREWDRRGLRPPQAPYGPVPERAWARNSVTTIMKNPALAGLSVYQGEIVHDDDGEPVGGGWEPILSRETWEAVCSVLDDPARRHPRGVKTLLGGLLACPCGNVITGGKSYQGNHVYRCGPATRDGREGPHTTVRAGAVDELVTKVILARLSRADLADLLVPPADVDAKALRTEAASIRRNLDELAADRALGLVTRSQMLTATERGNKRLEEIAQTLTDSEESRVLAPFLAGERAAAVWSGLSLARRRAVISTLCAITLKPAGRGARTFDPATVQVNWHQGMAANRL